MTALTTLESLVFIVLIILPIAAFVIPASILGSIEIYCIIRDLFRAMKNKS